MSDNDDSERKRKARSEAEAEDDRRKQRRKQRKEQQQLLEEQPLPNRTVSFSNIVGEKIIRDEKSKKQSKSVPDRQRKEPKLQPQQQQKQQQQHHQQQDSQQGGKCPTAALESALDTVILDLAAAIHHLQETGDIEVGGARVEGLSGVLDEAAANGADLEKIARNIQTLKGATRSLDGSETSSEKAALTKSLKDIFSVYAAPWKTDRNSSFDSVSSFDPSSSTDDEVTSSHFRADTADAVIRDAVIRGTADFVSSEAMKEAALSLESPSSSSASMRSSLSMLSISSADAEGWRLIIDDADNVNRQLTPGTTETSGKAEEVDSNDNRICTAYDSSTKVGEGEQGVEKGGEPAAAPPATTAAAGAVKKKRSCACTRSKEDNQENEGKCRAAGRKPDEKKGHCNCKDARCPQAPAGKEKSRKADFVLPAESVRPTPRPSLTGPEGAKRGNMRTSQSRPPVDSRKVGVKSDGGSALGTLGSGPSAGGNSICSTYSVRQSESDPTANFRSDNPEIVLNSDKCSRYSYPPCQPTTSSTRPATAVNSRPASRRTSGDSSLPPTTASIRQPPIAEHPTRCSTYKPGDDPVPLAPTLRSAKLEAPKEEESSAMLIGGLLLSGLGLAGLLGLLSRLFGGDGACLAGRHGLPVKVVDVSAECEMPISLTASNCYLGILNVKASTSQGGPV